MITNLSKKQIILIFFVHSKRICLHYIQKQIKDAFPVYHKLKTDTEDKVSKDTSLLQLKGDKNIPITSLPPVYNSSHATHPVDQSISVSPELPEALRSGNPEPMESESLEPPSQIETFGEALGSPESEELDQTLESAVGNIVEQHSRQSSGSSVETIESTVSRSQSGEPIPGKWEGGLHDLIEKDVEMSKIRVQESEISPAADSGTF
ncbi:hypothetical protein SK128_001759 [Halocaridina rubra]|uniref:Uncharacterized protein n=1 Tax=Halocaridina rubra TaxID=373956 RepID=A0AAN8XCQ8_HALRR